MAGYFVDSTFAFLYSPIVSLTMFAKELPLQIEEFIILRGQNIPILILNETKIKYDRLNGFQLRLAQTI
jgi:hypothetical protein